MSTNWPTSADSFPTATDFVTTVDATDPNNLRAALTAIEKWSLGPPWFNVMGYGALGNGVADDTTAINNALAAAITTPYGIVFFPPGTYVCSASLNAGASISLILQGCGGLSGGASTATVLKFTGTGRFIDARSSVGFQCRDLYVDCSNASFAGSAIDLSHGSSATDSAYACIRDCNVAVSGITSGSIGINLDKAIDSDVERCHFSGAAVQIQGAVTSSYSNAIRIRSTTHDVSAGGQAIVSESGQGWLLSGLTLEGGSGTIDQTIVVMNALGTEMSGLWAGDAASASTGTWLSMGSSQSLRGSYLAGASGMTAVSVSNSASGIAIEGNQFATLSVGIALGVTVSEVSIGANSYSAVTTRVSGTPASGVIEGPSGNRLVYGATPTLGALQTGIASQSISGNDHAGVVSITTGASPPGGAGALFILTFASAFPSAPVVVVQQTNTGSAGTVVASGRTSAGFTGYTVPALSATTSYDIAYQVTL